jgi:hypothetical protein
MFKAHRRVVCKKLKIGFGERSWRLDLRVLGEALRYWSGLTSKSNIQPLTKNDNRHFFGLSYLVNLGMGKQLGPIFTVGTYGPVCFYKADGEYLVRKSNPLSSKRVKTDKRFRRTMEESGLFANASRIASFVYRALPESFRQYWMYKSFIGEAKELLKEGKNVEEAKMALWKVYAEVWVMKEAAAPGSVSQQRATIKSVKPIWKQGKRRMPASKGLFIAALSPRQKPVRRILPKHLVTLKRLEADTG